ncbi:MAG: hypothetical protein Fur0043_05520 [Anaerolineales bacterium]
MLSLSKRLAISLYPIGAITLLWILIITKVFTLSFYDNEYDTLPDARQDVHPEWLPEDWYLNLDIGYRSLFNLMAGNLVNLLGFRNGAYVSRGIGYLAVAMGVYLLFRTVKIRFSLAFLCLFFFLKSQSLVAGEWILGGAETKTLSYAFVFLALACFLQKKYLTAFALSGLAASFHVLVGFYALFCTAVAILLNKEWRCEWQKILLNAWPVAITGINGIKVLLTQSFSSASPDADSGWMIYVTYRVPHHLYPATWEGWEWIARFGLGILLFGLLLVWQKSNSAKFLATYGWASAGLFLVGRLIYISGKTTLLRYYWFRFPDTMIPFLTTLLSAYILERILDSQLTLPRLTVKQQIQVRLMLKWAFQLGVVALLIISMWLSTSRLHQELQDLKKAESTDPLLTTMRWISVNTPRQAVFLINPSILEFYIYAERAVFVTWKTSPQTAPDMLEWYHRLLLCNGGQPPYRSGYASTMELQNNFYALDEEQINRIVQRYDIDYYLGSSQQNLSFERVYSNSSFTLYKIDKP